MGILCFILFSVIKQQIIKNLDEYLETLWSGIYRLLNNEKNNNKSKGVRQIRIYSGNNKSKRSKNRVSNKRRIKKSTRTIKK